IEENYRSNQHILDFTNSIIGNARIGYRKHLFSRNLNQSVPVIRRFYDQQEEAEFIVNRIMELSEQNVPLKEIAVLNRADWHNRYIQVELSRRGIPYVVVGGFRFNERMHIRDIIAYLRITYNPADAVSWHRVLKYIGGIGQVTAGNVLSESRSNPDPFFVWVIPAEKILF
ncbi:MAG TPA: 3'-5' exonuclease, partial [Bacteroidales bacterium]|nr:3'-5' exonuclease [Bacteroidales bacterium]